MGEITEIKEVENEIVKPYTLRKPKDKDLWPVLKIIKKIGLGEFKTAFVQVVDGNTTVEKIGAAAALDMADILVGNIGKTEAEMYDLFADLSGIPAEEIREMEFGTLPMMVYDFVNDAKSTSFFKVLSKLL